MFAKNRHYYFKRRPLIDGKFDEDVWTIRPRSKNNGKVDSAPFPEELVERCLAIGCPVDGVVFDPFVGAGTTMHVGLKRGNPAMGIEINPDFCSYILTTLQR
jgi:DNA modification methylase